MEKPEDLSHCEPETRVDVSVVPDVTDVNVSPCSEVTAFRDGFSFCSAWESVEPQSFSFSQKACSLLDSLAGRGEVRRLTSESASAVKKKHDAVNATAKFVVIV